MVSIHTMIFIWTWCLHRAYIINETPKAKETDDDEDGKVIDGDGEASEADPVEPKEWVPCPTTVFFNLAQTVSGKGLRDLSQLPTFDIWSDVFLSLAQTVSGRGLADTCPNSWQLKWRFFLTQKLFLVEGCVTLVFLVETIPLLNNHD